MFFRPVVKASYLLTQWVKGFFPEGYSCQNVIRITDLDVFPPRLYGVDRNKFTFLPSKERYSDLSEGLYIGFLVLRIRG